MLRRTFVQFGLIAKILIVACFVAAASQAADIGGYMKKQEERDRSPSIAAQSNEQAFPRSNYELATQTDSVGENHTPSTTAVKKATQHEGDRRPAVSLKE